MYLNYNSGPNRQQCINDTYKSFCCGSVYKSNQLFSSNPNALQLQFITDDFELCNPIGSKATLHKMCPIYFSIRNLPKQYASKVSNIYLVSLCRSDDIKTLESDFNDLWSSVVREVSVLEEEGISIDVQTKIKGTISYLGFDNLGANQSLGFVESFSSEYFCRFCTATKKETKVMTMEDQSKLRTTESYNENLKVVADSAKIDFKKTMGLKRSCALNDLKFFHIIENKTVE